MNPDKDTAYYHRLFDLYKQEKCTPAQIRELFNFLNNAGADKFILKDIQQSFDEIMEGHDEMANSIPVEPARRRERVFLFSRKPLMMAAAAILLIVISVFAFYLFRNDSAPSREINLAKNEILPGEKRATLTLANGSKILLDSTSSGILAMQGKASISAGAQGQVVYQMNNAGESDMVYNTISTPVGGTIHIVLSDGTQVWLNAGSSIRFPASFSGIAREVSVSGEAYFQVAKNPSIPFRVLMPGNEMVEVLGTHFNIMAYDNEPYTKVTLLEGSVRVKKDLESLLLIPYQQAVLKEKGILLLKNVAVSHAIAWKNGLFDFQNDNLPTIMRRIARWYDVEILYAAPTPDGHFTGSIRKSSAIREVLKLLELAGDVDFTIVGKKIIVNGKK